MTSAAVAHPAPAHRHGDDVDLYPGRAMLGAIIGYLVASVVLWLFKVWDGSQHTGANDAWQVALGLKWTTGSLTVGASGAILGFIGGVLGGPGL